MDDAALRALGETVIDWRFKGLPPDAEGRTLAEFAASGPGLFDGGFNTPVLTLDADALAHNLELMARWSAAHGLALAPHGKTTMAPQLFERQLRAGAWGITVAMPHQARVCRAFGVPRIFLANELVDAAALAWLAAELDADPGFRLVCYADSVRGVALMQQALSRAGGARPVEVVVEVGAPGGRTGVREAGTATAVADAVRGSDRLRLVGVAGYEAPATRPVPPADAPAAVADWLARLTGTARLLDAAGHFAGTEEIIVSAGGSEWFDAVAEALTGARLALSRPVLRLLRSGAYVAHDDGLYERATPFRRLAEGDRLRPALRLWAQVVSAPEPGLVLLNAGKRDVSFDAGLPVPLLVRAAADGSVRPAAGLTVTALADQHAFVSTSDGDYPEVGDWVALGLSHPCTVFDRWPLIPVVSAGGAVTDLIRTYF